MNGILSKGLLGDRLSTNPCFLNAPCGSTGFFTKFVEFIEFIEFIRFVGFIRCRLEFFLVPMLCVGTRYGHGKQTRPYFPLLYILITPSWIVSISPFFSSYIFLASAGSSMMWGVRKIKRLVLSTSL